MLAVTHIAAGSATALALGQVLHAPGTQAVLLVAGGVFGSMLPDIDHPASAFGRRVLPLSMAVAAVFGHRGVTHSLIAVGGVSLTAWFALHRLNWHPGYSVPFILGMCAGYLSHLLCDWATNSGVPLLWPKEKRFSAPVTFSTGSPFEYILALGLYAWTLTRALREFGGA
jgi:inner membrane protein